MKKSLSILLIIAAIFVLYGGAVSMNDVLASRTYWENENEKMTADLNKLEDGLNYLKDNEQAYLDGNEKLAKNEKKLSDSEEELADGEKKLAEGEADLSDGERTLAEGMADYDKGKKEYDKGVADYKTAPAKLAEAEKKLAEAKAALEDGETSLESLATLISSIQQILDGYASFRSGYKGLRNGRVDAIVSARKDTSGIQNLMNILSAYMDRDKDAALAVNSFNEAGKYLDKQNPSAFTNEQYDGFKNYMSSSVTGMTNADTFFSNIRKNICSIADKYAAELSDVQKEAAKYSAIADKVVDLEDELEAATAEVKAAEEAYNKDPSNKEAAERLEKAKDKETGIREEVLKAKKDLKGETDVFQKELDKAQSLVTDDPKEVEAILLAYKVFIKDSKGDEVTYNVLRTALNTLGEGMNLSDYNNIADIGERNKAIQNRLNERPDQGGGYGYGFCIGTHVTALSNISDGIRDIQTNTIVGNIESANKWINGYAQITNEQTMSSLRTLSGAIAEVIGGILAGSDKELISSLNKAANKAGFKPQDFTPAAGSRLTKDLSSDARLENYYQDMNKVENAFKSILPGLKDKLEDGQKTIDAGYKSYNEGKKDYEQGLADYEAAPAKMAAGRKELEAGLRKLMDARRRLSEGRGQLADVRLQLEDGRRKLEDGREALEKGREMLSEYEEGEQQYRDDLAAVMAAEVYGDLDSIMDRRNGDDDFDNGDTHLEPDEGIDAVATAREYHEESGVIINKEITSRFIGTAAVLAAAVLALLAAFLSLRNKNRAAGVFSILTAATAGFAAAYGVNAGSEFSVIAGSQVSALPWIACGILAAAGLAHSIVNFSDANKRSSVGTHY